MGSFYDFYNDFASRRRRNFTRNSTFNVLGDLFDTAYNRSHGGERYLLSQIPFYGWKQQFRDKVQYYQDYYDKTGKDVRYSQDYTSANTNSVGGVASGMLKPVSMARSLTSLYGADVKQNVKRRKR